MKLIAIYNESKWIISANGELELLQFINFFILLFLTEIYNIILIAIMIRSITIVYAYNDSFFLFLKRKHVEICLP